MIRCAVMVLVLAMVTGCAEMERLQIGAQTLLTGGAAPVDEVAPTQPDRVETPIDKSSSLPKARTQSTPKEPWTELIKTAERHCMQVMKPSQALLICDLVSMKSPATDSALNELSRSALEAKASVGIAARTAGSLAELERVFAKRGLRISQRNTSPNLASAYRVVFERK